MNSTKLSQKQQEMVCDNLSIVNWAAHRYYKKFNGMINFDDLYQEGALGLMDAVTKYSPDKNAGFKTYASIRVKGAIMDFIRSNDSLSRSVRKDLNTIKKAVNRLSQMFDSKPTAGQISKYLNMREDRILKLLSLSRRSYTLSLENENLELEKYISNDESRGCTMLVRKVESRDLIKQAMKRLNETEKKVVILYYLYEYNEREIKDILHLSNSRINQIRNNALDKLRSDFYDIEKEAGGNEMPKDPVIHSKGFVELPFSMSELGTNKLSVGELQKAFNYR